MKTKIQGNYVVAGQEAVSALYQSGYFGRPKDGVLYLRFVEAAYLLYRNKIEIFKDKTLLDFDAFLKFAALKEDFFELKYIVYKDLKERGYYIQSAATDFRIYPRGGSPGKTSAKSFVFVQSERIDLPFGTLIQHLNNTENVRKQFILALVDEESDITFFEIKRVDVNNSFTGKMSYSVPDLTKADNAAAVAAAAGPIPAILLKERVVMDNKAVSEILYNNAFFGKMLDEDRLQLSLVEALYLMEQNVIDVMDLNSEKMTPDTFAEHASAIEPEFMKKYTVYKDLKERSFVPKTGFKFGTHFRIYQKVESLDKIPHSEFLLHVISPDHQFKMPVTSGAIRLANSVHKRMIYAADTGRKIEYIEFERIKM
ncbi:hypothetical protein MsAg5_16700 [Methanosarcinaceae archaeon Ag5]|uniref:tRNA-splicing endonuclease n=1 Tax=Methanolapillus africanus TaxID=3028297 RepID=A0AAE4MKW9_9EURY|nr:hypothetical protein [Methanosarcinaceae archaeon Ag5]